MTFDRLDSSRHRFLERENRRWDERRGVDTCGWAVPDSETVVNGDAAGFPYAGTPLRLAAAVFEQVRPLDEGATFIDLGSGKGRMLILAAQHSFAAVVGVEYARDLHAIAETNLARASCHAPRARSLALDVQNFVFPDTPLVIYLNNPFPGSIMQFVLTNLAASYDAQPRPVTLVYQQLRHEDAEHATGNLALLAAAPFLTRSRLRVRGLLNRILLRPFDVAVFRSPEAHA